MWEVFDKLRAAKGVSLYQIGKELSINPSMFSNWKAGRYAPKTDKLQKIADYFGVSVEYLMTGKQPEEQDGYYVDPETAAIAQKIYQNKELYLLFYDAQDAKAEDLKLAHEVLLAMKRKELD